MKKQRTYNERRTRHATVNDDPELTVQSHKDNCNINRVLDRTKAGAGVSHLMKFAGQYGDFSDLDENSYEDMVTRLANARSIFEDLPAEIREEFGNNPGLFFKKVNDPEFKDRLEEIFPALAAPGRQFPDVLGQIPKAIQEGFDTLAAASSDAPPEPGAPESTEETPST